jgi:hypothetical protein
VLKLRRVNRQLNRVVTAGLNSLIYFDILRCDAAAELVASNPESRLILAIVCILAENRAQVISVLGVCIDGFCGL